MRHADSSYEIHAYNRVVIDSEYLAIRETCRLSATDAQQLRHAGFVIVPHVVAASHLALVQNAYDDAMTSGKGDDYKVASSTTRLNDLGNRGPAFDPLYIPPALLAAASAVIGAPFKLSSLLARTLRPQTSAQELHSDLEPNSDAFPMLGFIVMVDDFRADNGATRFVPGSHRRTDTPSTALSDRRAEVEGEVLACGTAGDAVLFNASTWHGHTANRTDAPRRSIQGYFVPRTAQSGSNLAARMKPETFDRMSDLAKYLLALPVASRV